MQKRTRIGVLSVLMGVLLLLSPSFHIGNPALFAVLVASVMYFGLYWVLEFNVIGLRLIFVFLLPIIFTFLFVQRLLSAWGSGAISFPIAVFFAILTYVLILTANILNVASVKKIPLLQVAQTSLYFFSTVTVFFAFDAIQGLEMGTILDVLIIALVGFIITYQLMWFILESRADLFNAALMIDLALVMIYFALSFFPIPYMLYNLVLATVFYILSGLFMHSAKKSLTVGIIIEYVVVIAVISTISILSLNWGSF